MIDREFTGFFIGGSWRKTSSDDRFEVISPASGKPIGSVPAATEADIDAAVAAAREAFDGSDWPKLTPAQRGAHLVRLATAIATHGAEFAELITDELGCSHLLSQVYQAVAPVMSLNYAAEVAKSLQTSELRVSDLSPFAGSGDAVGVIPMAGKSLVVKEPVGVVAVFPAYNFALPAVAQKIGPALVAGCTVVVKATEPNPLAIFNLGKLLQEIGFPAGVINIVAARAGESEYLVGHPGVDMVSFTGSTEVGRKIGAACGELIRPVVLELGGKSAAIVLSDADPEIVVPTLVGASVATNSGQSCVAQTRFLVPEEQYEFYADAFTRAFEALKVGDPRDADTVVGPVISRSHLERIEAHLARAVEQGATIRTGGRRPAQLSEGWYIEPTLVTGVTNDMDIAQHEIFGPVAVLIAHNGEADAIRIANQSRYGLAGSVFTADSAHGFEVARRIRTGTFSVNTFAADLGSPFGGFKESGLGREHGVGAVQEYLLQKTISIDPSLDLPEEVVSGVPVGRGPGITA